MASRGDTVSHPRRAGRPRRPASYPQKPRGDVVKNLVLGNPGRTDLQLGSFAEVVQILLEHDGAILLTFIEWLQNLGGLEHAQGLACGRPRAAEQFDDTVDRQDGVLGKKLEEADADHRGVCGALLAVSAWPSE